MQRKLDRYRSLGFVEDKTRPPIGKAAAEVAPAGMLLFVVIGIDHVLAACLRKAQQAGDFFRRVLQIVVHRDHVRAACLRNPAITALCSAVIRARSTRVIGTTRAR